jgi:DNA-binding MarR family transcriptional regulator
MTSMKNSGDVPASRSASRFAYDGLERLIHERARLSVMNSLLTHPAGLSFGELKSLCALSDGNLSRHLKVLHSARLVEISRGFERNRPQSICRITPAGRERYFDYLAVLEQVVRDATHAVGLDPASSNTARLPKI